MGKINFPQVSQWAVAIFALCLYSLVSIRTSFLLSPPILSFVKNYKENVLRFEISMDLFLLFLSVSFLIPTLPISSTNLSYLLCSFIPQFEFFHTKRGHLWVMISQYQFETKVSHDEYYNFTLDYLDFILRKPER